MLFGLAETKTLWAPFFFFFSFPNPNSKGANSNLGTKVMVWWSKLHGSKASFGLCAEVTAQHLGSWAETRSLNRFWEFHGNVLWPFYEFYRLWKKSLPSQLLRIGFSEIICECQTSTGDSQYCLPSQAPTLKETRPINLRKLLRSANEERRILRSRCNFQVRWTWTAGLSTEESGRIEFWNAKARPSATPTRIVAP